MLQGKAVFFKGSVVVQSMSVYVSVAWQYILRKCTSGHFMRCVGQCMCCGGQCIYCMAVFLRRSTSGQCKRWVSVFIAGVSVLQ